MPSRHSSGPLPWRRLARIAVAGAGLALLVLAAGRLLEIARLGRTDGDTRRRVEQEVGDAFDGMARSLQRAAAAVSNPERLRAAAAGDTGAARALFDAADAALRADPASELAITVYSGASEPVAWSGRPSELPPDRLQGPEAWFFARSALGLRLVYLAPVPGLDGRRIGTVAAERPLARPDGVASPDDAFVFPGAIAPVSIQLRFEAGRTVPEPDAFRVAAPSGAHLLTASVAPRDLAAVRARWRRATASLALITFGVSLLLLAGPLLDWRNAARRAAPYGAAALSIAAVTAAGRLLLRLASPADWLDAPLFSAATYASALVPPLLTSPFDFLLTAGTAAALAGLLLFAVEAWRIAVWRGRRVLNTPGRRLGYAGAQLAAGLLLLLLLLGYDGFLRDTIGQTRLDLLHLSLHPWDGARIALQTGLVLWHATTLGLAVTLIRAASVPWCVSRRDIVLRTAAVALWAAPLLLWHALSSSDGGELLPHAVALAAAAALGVIGTRIKARYRHGSQAFRLTMLTLAVVVPALAFYPSVFAVAWRAKEQLVESRFAPQAIKQRQTIQSLLQDTLAQVDRFPALADLVSARRGGQETAIDRAFQVWRVTSLAAYPLTSSVELYAPDGAPLSRFAFNLPEDLAASQRWQEPTCEWEIYEEVSPFFAEERRVLHAGRAVCDPERGTPVGSIVVHAMLDYENLPFISSQSPYVELLRPPDARPDEGISGRDVEYAVYGWSRTPLYASGDAAWSLSDAVFARVVGSRDAFWAELARGDARYHVHLLNDRGGIYALGFPAVSELAHLVNLAEVTVLAALTYALLLALSAVFGAFSRRGTTARALLREVRASFYRKLFLAFVLAAVLPVIALAVVTRAYVAGQARANIELEAIRTASAARRVVEDLAAPRAAEQGVGVDDNLMVWVSRLINQDVNIFANARLLATSERNLFASGLLPTRTPADVYRALALRMEASTVSGERIGAFEYMVAATRVKARQLDAILTVPLTSRQQEIEREIDTLDRRVLLAALLFILAGAGIGYSMAERIADPVNRLTRATRRIARGDLDARIAATSSDELRRLVEDFNSMARELQRQQKELERTHRLEAWAEMARQVAHEIKNPLTPIQLNAEHLRRVHADRGEPLGRVVQECVGTILTQVTLLRQIASEFSSFASSPTARPGHVSVEELVREVVEPYRSGLAERVRLEVDVPAHLPPVHVDRTLIARALTNLVENALHAMPGGGALTLTARHVPADGGPSERGWVRLRVSDTGVGMDAEALARAFEPYFSTKATGTGLGLPIARRNVELSGGTIAVASEKDRGTSVEMVLPVARTN